MKANKAPERENKTINDPFFLKNAEKIERYYDDSFYGDTQNADDIKKAIVFYLKCNLASRVIAINKINEMGDNLIRKYESDCPCFSNDENLFVYMDIYIVKKTDSTPELVSSHCDLDYEEKILLESACYSYFSGNFELCKNISSLFFEKMMNNHENRIIRMMAITSDLIKRSSQKRISNKRKKHRFYDEAIRKATITWQHFPLISYARMAKALDSFFGEGVSRETIEGWLKDAKLRPNEPVRQVSFTLMG